MLEIVHGWAASVVIAILAGSLLETLLPESAIKKYVKFAIALAVMLVILMPVVSLLSGKAQLDMGFSGTINNIELQAKRAEEIDLRQYKDYVYEVYMRNNQNMNE